MGGPSTRGDSNLRRLVAKKSLLEQMLNAAKSSKPHQPGVSMASGKACTCLETASTTEKGQMLASMGPFSLHKVRERLKAFDGNADTTYEALSR